MTNFYLGKRTVKQAGTLRPKSETINWHKLLGMKLNMRQWF